MKKIILGVVFLMALLFCLIIILSFQKSDVAYAKYYTIPRIYSFGYEEGKRITFDVYSELSKSMIEDIKENDFYIGNEKEYFILNNPTIKVNRQEKNKEVYYKYQIEVDLPNISQDDFILKDASLKISNSDFKLVLPLGELYIYKSYQKEVRFSDLYGNYSYVEGELHLVGITICFDDDYKFLQNMQIGSAYASLAYISKDVLNDSEIGLNLVSQPLESTYIEQDAFCLNAKSNYYFIPITYEKLALITEGFITFRIDDKSYYLADFCYIINDIYLQDYQNLKITGEFNNA